MDCCRSLWAHVSSLFMLVFDQADLFLVDTQTLRRQHLQFLTLSKRDSNHVLSFKLDKVFKNSFFTEKVQANGSALLNTAKSCDWEPTDLHIKISYPVLVLWKTIFIFVRKNFMLKKYFNYKSYIYVLSRFIKAMKLYIESETLHLISAEYKLEYSAIKIYYAVNHHSNDNWT